MLIGISPPWLPNRHCVFQIIAQRQRVVVSEKINFGSDIQRKTQVFLYTAMAAARRLPRGAFPSTFRGKLWLSSVLWRIHST